jgi:hypothetical protein
MQRFAGIVDFRGPRWETDGRSPGSGVSGLGEAVWIEEGESDRGGFV